MSIPSSQVLASASGTRSLVELQSMGSAEKASSYVAVKTSSETIQTVNQAEAEVMIEQAPEENQKPSVCQRLMNYVTKHPKKVIGVGLGLMLAGGVMGGSAVAARMHNNNDGVSSFNGVIPNNNSVGASLCQGGQVFLVDYSDIGDDSPACRFRIKKDGIVNSYSLFMSPRESKSESCHFVLKNAYPSIGTKIQSYRLAYQDKYSPELIFENHKGAIKGDITSKEPSINFEDNCDIPAKYNQTCSGDFLFNYPDEVNKLITSGLLKKIQ